MSVRGASTRRTGWRRSSPGVSGCSTQDWRSCQSRRRWRWRWVASALRRSRLRFKGRSAHAARPWQGKNALTKAGEFLDALHERPAEEVVVEGHPFPGGLTPT